MILLKALDIGCFVSKKVSTYKITAVKDRVCDVILAINSGISSAYGDTCAGGRGTAMYGLHRYVPL